MLTFKMDTEAADIYCLREFQDSVFDSVHKVFESSVRDRLGLQGWDLQRSTVVSPNGARTNYKGANRNPDAMQSAQDYKYSWFEEAHRASQDSIDKLLPTILRIPGAQCWFSANPQSSADPFSKRFIVPYLKELRQNGVYEDDLHYIVVVNWRDNPWWNEEQEALRAWDYDNLSRAKYDWIWEGMFNDSVPHAIISAEWFDAAIDAHEKLGFEPLGAKVVSHDPSDEGPDPKGLVYRHGSVLLDALEEPFGDVNEGCDWATAYAIQCEADHFIWDCDGLGVSLRRQVAQAFKDKRIEEQMFKGSEGVDDPGAIYQPANTAAKGKTNKHTFKNKRAQYYWGLRDRFHNTYNAVVNGQYCDPDEMISISSKIERIDELRAEVCRIPRKDTGNGLIQILSKVDMKKKPYEIDSPNMADSLMMSLSKLKTRSSFKEIDFASAHHG